MIFAKKMSFPEIFRKFFCEWAAASEKTSHKSQGCFSCFSVLRLFNNNMFNPFFESCLMVNRLIGFVRKSCFNRQASLVQMIVNSDPGIFLMP